MERSGFDKNRETAYAAEAKTRWGKTEAYRAYEEKAKGRTGAEQQILTDRMAEIFRAFGVMRELDPASDAVQEKVKELQSFLSENYYPCSDEILSGLGQMYTADERFTATIDGAGGEGTAAFVRSAIEAYCNKT